MAEQLLYKTLCYMLPYRVKINYYDRHIVMNTGDGAGGYWIGVNAVMKRHGDNCKPLLRSLNQLTKEIEHNGESFEPLQCLYERSKYEEIKEFVIHMEDYSSKPEEISWDCCPVWVMEKLLEWHFNIFSLPKELYEEK